jgi:hypothetical protein
VRLLAPSSLQEELALDVEALRASPVSCSASARPRLLALQVSPGEKKSTEERRGQRRRLGCGTQQEQDDALSRAGCLATGGTSHGPFLAASCAARTRPSACLRLTPASPGASAVQLALMQAIMDHHHGSYSSELRAAAAALARQERGSVAAPC